MDVTSATRIVDRVSARLPYLYFSSRCGMLGVMFAAMGAWALTGFNIVEGAVPLIGIQYSTVATFSFFFWLMMANFQGNGFRAMSDLTASFNQDIRFLFRVFTETKGVREDYPKGPEDSLDAFRACAISLLACMGALFAFESIWVPLYDYFQFGSLLWPVYYAVVQGPPVAMRNMVLGAAPFFMIPLLFATTFDISPTHLKKRFDIRWRLDSGLAWMILIAVLFWLTWITFPHATAPILQVIGPDAAKFSFSNCYIFPKQGLFPQNTYTFYPCDLLGRNYTPPQILGFFDSNPWVHLVNVLTKFATFGAVIYPAMAFVKRAA